jgi:lysophospholipase L1-like esterase
MKTTLRSVVALSLLIILAQPRLVAAGDLVLQKGDRVAVVGDSITEQKQYSRFIETYLLACVPQLDLTVCQFGWSGERAPGFANRMDADMVPWQPTVVTTCYGMNDGTYRPYTDQIGAAYEEGARRIQDRCKALGVRMIVGGPGVVDADSWRAGEPDADRYYNDNLAQLSAIAKRLADERGFVYAGLHPLMLKVMTDAKAQLGSEYHVAGPDGVHPGANGHLVMAYAFLKAMGLDGQIGAITVDMNAAATVTEGHRVLSASGGLVEIESSRYPFCFTGDDKNPSGTRSILPFLPFNQDLNRFTLTVTNLSAPAADVTWGDKTLTLSKAQLEAAVNLAELFDVHPLSAPFTEVDKIVAQKQNRETRLLKHAQSRLRYMDGDFADDAEVQASLTTLRTKIRARLAADAAEARAAVKPVTHTLRITPKP